MFDFNPIIKAGVAIAAKPDPISCEALLFVNELVSPYSNQYVVDTPFGTTCPVTKAEELDTVVFGLVTTVGALSVSGAAGAVEVAGIVVSVVGAVVAGVVGVLEVFLNNKYPPPIIIMIANKPIHAFLLIKF